MTFAVLNIAGLAWAVVTGEWRLRQIYDTAYFPIAGTFWLLGALGLLPRVQRSTKNEGHERRYFYGSVWAVCVAQPVSGSCGPCCRVRGHSTASSSRSSSPSWSGWAIWRGADCFRAPGRSCLESWRFPIELPELRPGPSVRRTRLSRPQAKAWACPLRLPQVRIELHEHAVDLPVLHVAGMTAALPHSPMPLAALHSRSRNTPTPTGSACCPSPTLRARSACPSKYPPRAIDDF